MLSPLDFQARRVIFVIKNEKRKKKVSFNKLKYSLSCHFACLKQKRMKLSSYLGLGLFFTIFFPYFLHL